MKRSRSLCGQTLNVPGRIETYLHCHAALVKIFLPGWDMSKKVGKRRVQAVG